MKLILVLLALSTCMLSAAERVALVIGNNAYQNGSPLKNCVNDARAVAKALEGAGFEVIKVEDAGLAVMEAKVLEFQQKAKGAKAAWFHYSGHGTEVAGANYLIPVDADVKEEFQVKHKTYALDQVLGALNGAATPLKVVVLDCCRDNPFGRGWSRNNSSGLAQVGDTPAGTIIAFATSPGKVAADGAGANSPFTTALVAALAKPGLEIDQVFKETGRQVIAATASQQRPWTNSSFFDSFVPVAGRAEVAVVPSPAPRGNVPVPIPATPPTGDSELDRGKVGKTFVAKLPGGLGMTFCHVPPGSFEMGSPEQESYRMGDENQVPVRIRSGFWMAKTECTQAQWRAVMGSAPSNFRGDKLPVETVSWEDAQEFLVKVNRAGGLPKGWKWALPTEAQWEYACRAGSTTAFSFGNSASGQQANFNGQRPYGSGVKKQSTGKTVAVGSYQPNPWGLQDMHGNVNEWCADWYAEEMEGGVDPAGSLKGSLRVVRGGGWQSYSEFCRAAVRVPLLPGTKNDLLGFRLVLVPAQ